jgi:prepilin-type N-terminal cleavage/methylation domain-containing protein
VREAPARRTGAAPGRGRAGFSLIEIIVAVAILSLMLGAVAPLALRQMDAARREATRREMKGIASALVGDAASGEFGYLGDMGELPATLADLNDATGKPAWSVSGVDGIGYGFAGPYAPYAAAPGDPIADAWGLAYQYDGSTAQVTSAGPDRSFGTADDLRFPPAAAATTGSVSVSVLGLPASGPAVLLAPSDFRVWVVSSSSGSRSESEAFPATNPFGVGGLHLGLHGLRARGEAGVYGGVEDRRVVTVRRGQRAVELVLEEP